MRQSINRACVAPTQSNPLVVRRRLRGLPARISPLGVLASAQGCGLKILKIPRPRSFVRVSVRLDLVRKRTRVSFSLWSTFLSRTTHSRSRLLPLSLFLPLSSPFLSVASSLRPSATFPPRTEKRFRSRVRVAARHRFLLESARFARGGGSSEDRTRRRAMFPSPRCCDGVLHPYAVVERDR